MALHPDRDLGDARAAIDRGDGRAAVKSLDRARRGYAKAQDSEGLEHVVDMVALVDQRDERTRVGSENVGYAAKQNLRQESRRLARQRGEAWVDPYPDLQAPSEHTGLVLTRRVKILIGIAVALVTALIASIFILPFVVDESSSNDVTLRLINDTPAAVTVRGCDDSSCDFPWLDRDLEPGLETQAVVSEDDLIERFKVEDECLPVRIHDAAQRLAAGESTLAVRLSRATPCPGTTVLPVPAAETPL